MFGVYNDTCIYEKKGAVNKYNVAIPTIPIELQCSKSTERVYVRDDKGERLIYKGVYNLRENVVKVGDKIDGYIITAVSEGRGVCGELLTVKVVVDNV